MKSIVIVDHEEFMRNYMQNLLWKEGYENAMTFESNEQLALALGRKIDIDVILLDIVLLNRSKWQIIQTIRSIKQYATTPLIVTTHKSSLEERKKIFSVWADDYIVKPFPAIELLHRIRKAISYTETINRKLTNRFKKRDAQPNSSDLLIFSGTIAEISTSSLFSFVEMSEISGKLVIESKKQQHTFHFNKGNVTSYHSTLGVNSIEELLSVALHIYKGSFQFFSEEEAENQSGLSPSMMILKSIQDDKND